MRYMTLVMSLPLVIVKPMSFQTLFMSVPAFTWSSTFCPQPRSTSGASAIRSVSRSPSRSVAVDDGVALLIHVVQQDAEVGVGDVLVDLPAPVLHAGLEVLGQQRDDRVDVRLVLGVGVDGVLAVQLELRALQQPAHDSGVDRVFLRLRGLGRDAPDIARLVHHLQEQAHRVGHTHARGVHLRVDVAGRRCRRWNFLPSCE